LAYLAVGTFLSLRGFEIARIRLGDVEGRQTMHGLIYLIGLIVVIMAILSFFGLR